MATIAENLDRIVDAKEAIRGAIIDKGVQVPSDAKIDEYSAFVGQIQGGGGEDTLKMYIDGTIVKDGVLDLSNYDTLINGMFSGSQWTGKIHKIILSQNIETIPYQCLHYANASIVENLDKVKYIEESNIGMANMRFVNLDSCIKEVSNVAGSDTHTKIYGENIKIIAVSEAYSLENLYIYSLVMPKIFNYDNVGAWVSSRTLNCHCWMDGATTNALVTEKGYSVKYFEELISQTYTGETSFDVSDVDIHLTLPYEFKYTFETIEGSKDVVYDKKLSVYPVKEETTKVVPITTAQSTDEFTLNVKPFTLKAPDMDLYYEFDVMEDCVINNAWWRTIDDNTWVVWCDGELTTPETIYNFKKGERHNFGLVANNGYVFANNHNIFDTSSGVSYVLKPSYIEVNRTGFDYTFYTNDSKFANDERFCDLVVSFRTPNKFDLWLCIKKAVYLEGIDENNPFTVNGCGGVDVYIVADDLSNCGTDIRDYRWNTEKPNVYLKGELAQQLWNEDEYFKKYINKFDVE